MTVSSPAKAGEEINSFSQRHYGRGKIRRWKQERGEKVIQKGSLLYEGKAKKVYVTEDPACYIVDYKDDTAAFNGLKKGTIVDKGAVNNRVSNLMFRVPEKDDIPAHSVKELNDRETLVKKVEIAPLGVIVRNKAVSSLAKHSGLEEGTLMRTPVLEFCYKDDELDDPMVNEYHILAADLAMKGGIDVISKMALRINELVCEFFRSVNIKLTDFKFEFGRCNGKIILVDEISPDTCRFWDIHAHEKLDKGRSRRNLGDVEEAYAEVMKRIGL